ncbi:neuromedin-U isoform X3 [Octodon degus]|uniref:Neuromedin-U isoform X3 n=1 Tax=Octodon degus TaxID=10160 RepID=A0A6P6E3F6_OCTDE|nr:neuromedin-U isoform X3 [Octodon degus]
MPQSPGQVGAAPLLPLLLLLACCAAAGGGARELPYGIWSEQQLQLWNKISDACSSFLSTDSRPQDQDEKDNTKRFLFHYSKTQKLGNSNVVSSVVHPLLQLVPQLHERRMKRFQANEAFRSPFANRRRGYFLFRPRNGRSAGFI